MSPPGRAAAQPATDWADGETGLADQSHGTPLDKLAGTPGFIPAWRRLNPSGPHLPLVVAELRWQRACREAEL